MRKALITLIVCGVMVSAFAMTSAVSAAPGGQDKSPIEKIKFDFGDLMGHGISNTENGHIVLHISPKSPFGPENFNSKNRNGPAPPL